MRSFILVASLFFLPNLASPQFNAGEFSFNGYLDHGGVAMFDANGLFTLTSSTRQKIGHIFYKNPVQFKNSTNGSVHSFSTTFIFAIVSEYSGLGGQGLAFVIAPDKNLTGLPSQYLGLLDDTNNGNSTNHIVAIELDTVQSPEFSDINDNHVGIDINGLRSKVSASAGYFTPEGGFKNLNLISGKPMQIWVEYDGDENIFNVTLHPIDIRKPKTPLLSLKRDLSSYLYENMYVGFSSSTGSVITCHYVLAWNFKINGRAEEIDVSRLPKFPQSVNVNDERLQKILTISLSLTGFALILVLIFAAVWISRKKKYIEILEEWEVLYGPHRFSYKDLFKATKGFKQKELLGKGGFGRVYKGNLPSSNAQIAVKRISHDSRQGMREFVAEIATIGRLRHPNLVRLLGYCRRKHELLLVYDYMPNGSLDKFLYHLPDDHQSFTWTQRFKIIKDVASALFYLHQQWIQVVIHRDIKPANVLIDGDMNARLGDFGLAKLCDLGSDPETSHVAGTLGYMAPELARTGKASTSTDIYAFGMFILEVACGRRPIDPRASVDEISLVDWIMDCWDRGHILESIDKRLGNRYVVQEAELILKLGLLCSHQVAAARPSLCSVQQLLDGVARFPDNLSSVIKARDFPEGSNDVGAPNVLNRGNSIPPLTITESLASHGR